MSLPTNVEAEDNVLRSVLLEERRDELSEIARDTELLAESFSTVSQLVQKQGTNLNEAARNTEVASDETGEGTNALRRASESRRFWWGAGAFVAGTITLTVCSIALLEKFARDAKKE